MHKRYVLIMLLLAFLVSPLTNSWALRLDIDSSTLVYPTQSIEESGDELKREIPLYEYLMVNLKVINNLYIHTYSLLDINYTEERTDVAGNLFYGYVNYSNIAKVLDIQAGRQFMITGLGFAMFDGALLNIHPIKGLSIKPYFGIPVNEDFSQEKLNEALKSEQIYGGSATYNFKKMNFGLEFREQTGKDDAGEKMVVERLAGIDYDFQVSRKFSVLANVDLNLLDDAKGVYPKDMLLSTDWRVLSKLRWVSSFEFYKPFLPNNSFMFNLFSPITQEPITLNLARRYQVKETFVVILPKGLSVNAFGGYNIYQAAEQENGYIAGLGLSSRKFLNTNITIEGSTEKDPEYTQSDVQIKVNKYMFTKIARLGLNFAGGMTLYDIQGKQDQGQFAYLEAVIGLTRAFDIYVLTEYFSNPVYNFDVRFLLKVNFRFGISMFE